MSVMFCIGATFVKKNSCLVAGIVPFDTVGLHLLTFRIYEPYPSEDIAFDLSHVISHLWHDYSTLQVLFESMLVSFPTAKI